MQSRQRKLEAFLVPAGGASDWLFASKACTLCLNCDRSLEGEMGKGAIGRGTQDASISLLFRSGRVPEHWDLHLQTEAVPSGHLPWHTRLGGWRHEIPFWCGRSTYLVWWVCSMDNKLPVGSCVNDFAKVVLWRYRKCHVKPSFCSAVQRGWCIFLWRPGPGRVTVDVGELGKKWKREDGWNLCRILDLNYYGGINKDCVWEELQK